MGPEPALAARRRVAAPAGPAGAPRGSGRGAVVGGACGARSLRCKRSCTSRRARALAGAVRSWSERAGWVGLVAGPSSGAPPTRAASLAGAVRSGAERKRKTGV